LNASVLTVGTVPDARFPATLPAVSGVNLTSLNASNLASGTIANARTTAASANGASTIVARDASGNFSAGTITANLTGTASTATNAATVTGATQNSITSIPNLATVGNITSGTWSGSFGAVSGANLTNLNGTNIASGTVANARTTAASANGASTIVARDASGNFLANSVQFNSFGVGTAASGTAGEIRATNNITAYYSDERLKTKIGSIDNALEKVKQIETMVYHANETAVALGYDASIIEVGVTAQSVERVMPQTVAPAPIDDKYLTVRYERLVPLLIEAIKELEAQVAELKAK
jgi:hypothetical protein